MALDETGDSGFDELPAPDSATAAQTAHATNLALPDEAAMPFDGNPAATSATQDLPQDLETWLDAQERQVLVRALDETGFNRTAAAARLGLNLRQIRYCMSRLGITEPSDNDTDDAAG